MSPETKSPAPDSVRYSRILRLREAVALGIGVGTAIGVFTLLGILLTQTDGQNTVGAYLLMGVVALPIVLTYVERGSVIAGSGGIYNLSRSSSDLRVTFASGWIMLGGYVNLVVLMGWGVALYVDLFLDLFFGILIPGQVLAIGAILLSIAINMFGTSINWRNRTIFIFAALTIIVLILVYAIFASPAMESVVSFSQTFDVLKLTALILGSLWGLDFILRMRDEIQRPTRNILPSMMLMVLGVAVLGILSTIAILRYDASFPNETIPIVEGIPDIGGFSRSVLILIFALTGFSIIMLTLNRSIINALELIGIMEDDGYFSLKITQRKTSRGLPRLPLLIFIFLSILLILSASIFTAAGLTAIAFLLVTALVHVPDVFRRVPNLPEKRRPRLPFHPLFPGLTTAIGIFLPLTLIADLWVFVLIWAVFGFVYYMLAGRRRANVLRRQEIVIGETDADVAQNEAAYQVMVGVSNAETASDLIRAGAKLAAAHNGELLIIKILLLVDQMPGYLKRQVAEEEWKNLDVLVNTLDLGDVPVRSLVRLASNVTQGLLEAVREEGVDFLLVGWTSPQFHEREVGSRSHPALNSILRYAPCDVGLVRGKLPNKVNHLLIPTAGGPHASIALSLGRNLIDSDEFRISLLHIVDKTSSEEAADAQSYLHATEVSAQVHQNIEYKVIESYDITTGIISQAHDADLVMLGASKQLWGDRAYFGGVAKQTTESLQTPAIVTRRYEKPNHPWLQRLWEIVSDPLPTLAGQRHAEVMGLMRESAEPTVDFFVLITLAAAIAVLGLLQNSAAVIIGAMLVAPLMSPILSMSMSMVIGNLQQLRIGVEATVKGISLAIFVGLVIAFFSPLDAPTNEIMARTQPNLLDLMVALFSGAAAGYAISRKEVAAALPGVAIAAALVPPLTVVGYGLAVSDLQIASGAMLLFITNLIAIVLAAALVFLALGFQPDRTEQGGLVRSLQIAAASLVGIGIILGVITFSTIQQGNREQGIVNLFTNEVASEFMQVQDLNLIQTREGYTIVTTLINFSGNQPSTDMIQEWQDAIHDTLGENVVIDATAIEGLHTIVDAEQISSAQKLGETFQQRIEEQNAIVLEYLPGRTENNIEIQSMILLLESSTLTDQVMQNIQQELTEMAGESVIIRAYTIDGTFNQYDEDSSFGIQRE